MEELLSRHADLSTIRKLGEGTFAEIFKAGSVVYKIIPIDGTTLINGDPQMSAAQLRNEAAICFTLNELRMPALGESCKLGLAKS